MGFFSGIANIAGAVATATGNPGIGAGLSALGGYLGQQDTNSANAAQFAQANAFTKEMYQNRYQWQVQDLQKAGLNPMLAYTNGAPTVSSSSPIAMQNPSDAANRSLETNNATSLNRAVVEKTQADTTASKAVALNQQTQASLNSAQEAKVKVDTALSEANADNVKADTYLKSFQTALISAQQDLAAAQASKNYQDIQESKARIEQIQSSIRQISADILMKNSLTALYDIRRTAESFSLNGLRNQSEFDSSDYGKSMPFLRAVGENANSAAGALSKVNPIANIGKALDKAKIPLKGR